MLKRRALLINPPPTGSGPKPEGVTSNDEGRNAIVSLYPDRIERVKARSWLLLSHARQDTEIIPIKAISSSSQAVVDVADQIRKLAELRDQGLLTNEEFDARKRRLLDL